MVQEEFFWLGVNPQFLRYWGGGVGNCSEMSDILNAYCIIKLLRAIVFKSQTKSNYFGKGRKLKFARLLHIASP